MKLPFKLNRRLAAWSYLALLALALAACAPATKPTTQAAPTQQAATLAPSEPPGQAAPTAQAVISTEFTPSDPAQVSLAAGRPQLVEFFAFW
jgi:hypothetical protein